MNQTASKPNTGLNLKDATLVLSQGHLDVCQISLAELVISRSQEHELFW